MSGTAVKGIVNVGLEPSGNPGRQTVLPATSAASTLSATNQPTVTSVGVHLYIVVTGIAAGASATITIAGKLIDGATAVSETTTPISQSTMMANGIYDYCTIATYGSINANGITCSSVSGSLSGATITVYAIMGGKFLVPITANFDADYEEFSPQDNRGLIDEDVRITQLIKKVSFDMSGALYPESSQFFIPACISSVTNPATPASNPGSPTSLKAATTFTVLGATYTLTTQPTAPGMILAFALSGNSAAGTLTISGTAPGTGAAISEVVKIGANNTPIYSTLVYVTVTSIAVGGTPTGAATLATSGVYAYNPVYNPTDTLIPLSAEWYDGTSCWVTPYVTPEEWTIEYDVNKELKFSMKGAVQDLVAVGDLTASNLTSNQFATYTQPTDLPIVGWPGLFYIDPLSGTAGTTQSFDIITFKITGTTGLMPYWTASGQQVFNRVGRKRRKITFEAEIDMTNQIQYQTKYKPMVKQIFTARFQGPYIGPGLYKYIQFVLLAKMTKWKIDPKEEKVMAQVTGTCEYESSFTYSHQVTLLNQNPPTYAS